MSSYDSFRRAIEKVQGPLTPTMGPSFRGRPTPYGITEGDVDLPYDPDAILPPDAPVDQQVIGTTAAITPAPAVAAPVATAPAKDLLAAAEQQSDPYGALTKTQKRMLAFAAIADAGMALQGKEGTKVATLLGDFTRRADQARKERQAQAAASAEAERRAFLMGLMPTASVTQAEGSGGVEMPTSAQLEAQIQALGGQLGAFVANDQLDFFNSQMSVLKGQLETAKAREAEQAEKKEQYGIDLEQTTKQMQATDRAMKVAERALTAAGKYGSVDEMLSALNAGEYDPSSFFITRQGIVPDSKEFRDFQSFAEQFSSIMTFQNLQTILDTGAKLGTLSDADLRAIGAISGPMDAVNNPRQTAQNIQFAYTQLMEEMQQQEEALAELKLKGY